MKLVRSTALTSLVAAFAIGASTLAGAAHHGEMHGQKKAKDIIDTAIAAGSFNTLVTAVKAANLVDTLKGEGPFTVFAPTDAAFAKLPADELQALLKDKEALTRVLTYHVVPGKVMANDVAKIDSAKTVQGQRIKISKSDGVRIDNAKLVTTDIETSNGVIHVIDTVILPKDNTSHYSDDYWKEEYVN